MATDTKQTGIRFPESLMGKLKYIAMKDRRTFTNALIIMVEDGIAKWEAENGQISERDVDEKVFGRYLTDIPNTDKRKKK